MVASVRKEILKQLSASLDVGFERLCEMAVGLLHDSFDHYSWVGLYVIEGDQLSLISWKGPSPTEHTMIRVGEGICGSAALSGTTEIVNDVSSDDRYIACFLSTKSEIVVPILAEGTVVGEIDIDSDVPSAFGEEDKKFLEEVAAILGRAKTR